ncbi:MAG: SDR family oxidoreductase [Verrucomicrobiota bacterium]
MATSSKTALITGASTGIGKEFAHIHAESGGDLVIVARSEDKLNALKAELEEKHSVQVTVIPKDLTEPNSAQEIYEAVKAAGIEIDYLINNAGFGGQGKFHERPLEQDLAMIQLNVTTLTALCRVFLPDFVARDSGRILNVSSTASLPPGGPLQSVYFATKHYVTAFSYGVADELHDSNVTVTALLPGATETEFANSAGLDDTELFAKAFSARSVAEDGYKGMIDGQLKVISGLTFAQKMMMAAVPFTPTKMLLGQIRKMQEKQSA